MTKIQILKLTVIVAEEDYRTDLSDWYGLTNEERVQCRVDAYNRDATQIFVQTWFIEEGKASIQGELNELLGRTYKIIDSREA